MARLILLLSFFAMAQVHSLAYTPRFSGLFGTPTEDIYNLPQMAPYYLPYNPVVVEIGGFEGRKTVGYAHQYPDGQVYVFEPNLMAYKELLSKVQHISNVKSFNLAISNESGATKLYLDRVNPIMDFPPGFEGSLLKKRTKNECSYLDVPCVTLTDWCNENGVDHIDYLVLDVEGFELQILQSSSKLLENVKVICTKTNQNGLRVNISRFATLKNYLNNMGFEMLCHWYREGLQGEATFIRKEVYNSLYE